MQSYVGVKRISGQPMDRAAYNAYRNWDLPADERGADEGYLVEYLDSPDSNHPDHEHYISWCPKDQFEFANRPVAGLTFGHALEVAKQGEKIARAGWNGKGQFVVAMPELQLPPHNTQEPGAKVNDRTAKFIGEDTPLNCRPYFALYNAQKEWVPGWVPSQGDLFAEDWTIVE